MITTDLDPFQIATLGVTGSPITMATDGYIILIEEEIIEVPVGGGTGQIDPYYNWPTQKPQYKKKKKITAIVTIAGVEYKESIELDDLSITAKNIQVEISEGTKPTIKLSVIRG